MKIRNSFVANSSSSSFILPKKDLSLEQIRGLGSWVNIHNNQEMGRGDDHFITETTNYFYGSVSLHTGLKEQLEGLSIKEEQYDLEEG